MRCPNPARSVQVRAHCRPLPRRRPTTQFNPFVLANACREQTRRYVHRQEKRAGASSPQGA